MTKKCPVCSHVGELTWRDGKYYCAMCSSEVPETDPVVQPVSTAAVVSNVTCPICRNTQNNTFDNGKYRCSLCGTTFDAYRKQEIEQKFYQGNSYNSYTRQQIADLEKKKDRTLITACICVVIFWPVSIYFFYKFAQINKELKALKR